MMDNDLPTSRQLEMLRLYAAGYSFKQIAQAMEISRFTVYEHKNRLLVKLRVFTLSSAITEAHQRRLIDLDEVKPIKVPRLRD